MQDFQLVIGALCFFLLFFCMPSFHTTLSILLLGDLWRVNFYSLPTSPDPAQRTFSVGSSVFSGSYGIPALSLVSIMASRFGWHLLVFILSMVMKLSMKWISHDAPFLLIIHCSASAKDSRAKRKPLYTTSC